MSKKVNYHTIRYGQKDGELKFGHLHNDDVLSAVLLRSAYDYRHYMTFDVDDNRKGWTTFRTPATHQIKCGDDTPDEFPAFFVDAINGDVIINAPNGRIKLIGKNVDIIATGNNNQDGVITLDGNEAITCYTKNFTVESRSRAKIVSSGICELVGEGIMNIYGGLFDCVDGRTKRKPSN
jgi:hypothetical protein